MGFRFLPSGFAWRFRTDVRTLSCRRIRGGPTLSERALALDRIAGTLVVFCALLSAAWLATQILPTDMPAVAESAQADAAAADGNLQALRPDAERLDTAELRAVQIRLRSLGFDPGVIDGIAGARTLGALNQYRASRNLGRVSWIDRANVAGLLN